MDPTWLKKRTTVADVEAASMVSDPELGPEPVPFGFINAQWKALLAQMQPGDELWEFSSSQESWQALAGRAGIALVRTGKVVDSMVTMMS
ncbi:MAG: hypothetical protein L0241_10250 [Planctomycetia bacterium]|nr:hypothetical protein [Planctomycetia bacterium]